MSTSSSDWDDSEEQFTHNCNLQGIITAWFIQYASEHPHLPRCTRRKYQQQQQLLNVRQGVYTNTITSPRKSSSQNEVNVNSVSSTCNTTLTQKVTQSKKHMPRSLKEVILNALQTQDHSSMVANNNISNNNNNNNSVSNNIITDNKQLIQCQHNKDNISRKCENANYSIVAQQIVSAIKSSSDPPLIASSIIRALQDPLNGLLRKQLLSQQLSAQQLVNMDDESLLNPITRSQVAQQRQRRLEQKTVQYIEQLYSVITNLYTCPQCGNTECYANFRSTDFVKWQGDDPTPTLLTCTKCRFSFKA